MAQGYFLFLATRSQRAQRKRVFSSTDREMRAIYPQPARMEIKDFLNHFGHKESQRKISRRKDRLSMRSL
jgi:hypothetical protein